MRRRQKAIERRSDASDGGKPGMCSLFQRDCVNETTTTHPPSIESQSL